MNEYEKDEIRRLVEVANALLRALTACRYSMDRQDEPGSLAYDRAMQQAAEAIENAEKELKP